MKKLLVVLAICFMSVFSFTGVSEASWVLFGTDPDIGPFWYEPTSIMTGKDPGTVSYQQMINALDGTPRKLIHHVLIDKSRMYATIYWGQMTDNNGKVLTSQEERIPLVIADLKPTWRNMIAKVLQIYDSKR